MPKPYRGKTLWNLPSRGRGTCPICRHTRVKLLYALVVGEQTIKVCKKCRRKSITELPPEAVTARPVRELIR